MFCNARYYDPQIGRFISADSVVPGNASGGMDGVALRSLTVDFHEAALLGGLNTEGARADRLDWGGPGDPQGLNRYSYVRNNPMRWTDPTGHDISVDYDQATMLRQQLVNVRDDTQGRADGMARFWNTWIGACVGAFGNVFTTLASATGGGAVGNASLGDTLANPKDTQAVKLYNWMIEQIDEYQRWTQNPAHPGRAKSTLTFWFEASQTSDSSRPYQYYLVSQYGDAGPQSRIPVSPAMYWSQRKFVGQAKKPKG